MSKPVVLNIENHKNIRINIERGAEFGENIHLVPILADELKNLAVDVLVLRS